MGKGDRKKPIKSISRALKVAESHRNGTRRAQRQIVTEDPRKAALAARARLMGFEPTKENMLAMTGVHLGNDIGRCLEAVAKNEAPELWAVWAALCNSIERYYRRILGQTGVPSGMRIEMEPERIEADKSHTIDERTEDERDEDAKKAYERWKSIIAELPIHDQSLIWQGSQVEVWGSAGPTARGFAMVTAIRRLKEAVDKGA